MNKKMYVGNLSWDAREDDLVELFGQYGEVEQVQMVMDRETGRPRGFAFVTMATREGMEGAIEALSGFEFMGRAMVVNEAREKESSGGFGGGNRGGFGGGNRGGFDRRGGGGGNRNGGGGGRKNFSGGGRRRDGYGQDNGGW